MRRVRSPDVRAANACAAGIVVMVLLLLCGVNWEAIVEDYMMSEQVLKQSRMHDELDLDGACAGARPDALRRLAQLESGAGAVL